MKIQRNKRTIWFLILLEIIYVANGLQNSLTSRREFAATIATGVGTLVSPKASISIATPADRSVESRTLESKSMASQLLAMIPVTDSGAPATNATIPKELSSQIEDFVALMERTNGQKNNAKSSLLSGSWRLLYSNAPEIVSLSKGLPLGFVLGPTYQPLDTVQGFFENNARLEQPLGLVALATNVVGSVSASKKGTINAAGVVNENNNRVDIRFEAIIFEVDEIFGRTLKTPIRKTIIPKSSKSTEGALPANDQTYLDEKVRVVRGGDGSLFIFERELYTDTSGSTMMTAQERADVLASSSSGSTTTPVGIDLEREKQDKITNANIPAEIKFLFQNR